MRRADVAVTQGSAPAPPALDGPEGEGSSRSRLFVSPIAVGVALSVILALWATRRVWGPGIPAGGDVAGHLVRTQVGLEIVSDLDLDGWSTRWGVGYQQFLYYGPGFTWAMGLIRLATFGTLADVGAMKAAMIGSFAATGPAVAFLAWAMGLDKRAVALAAVAALAVSNPYGVGLGGLFGNGLVPQQVASVLLFVAMGATLLCLDRPGSRWAAVTAASVAAIIVTHPASAAIYGLFVVCTIVLLAVTRDLTRPGLARLGIAVAGAVCLSAFWLLPFLAHQNLQGAVATWNTPPFNTRVADMLAGKIVFRPLVVPAVVAGMAYGFVRVGQRLPKALLLSTLPVGMLVLGHWLMGATFNPVTSSLANRELGVVGVLLLLPLASGVSALGRRIAARSWIPFAGGLAVVAWLFVAPLDDDAPAAVEDKAPSADMQALAAALRTHVPPHARFATARDWPADLERGRVGAPDRWLAWASGRNTLNPFPLELSSVANAAYTASALTTDPPEMSAKAMARYGVSHVAVLGLTQLATLAGSGHFDPVWQQGSVGIVEVLASAGQPAPSSQVTTEAPAMARVHAAGREHLVVEVGAEQATSAAVAIAWSPKWRAAINGRPVPLIRAWDGLIEVRLPAGTSRIDLRFGADGWDGAGVVISGLTLLTGMWFLAGRHGHVAGVPSSQNVPWSKPLRSRLPRRRTRLTRSTSPG